MQLLRGRFWPTLLALGPSPRPLSTLRGRLRAVCSATGADADGFDTLGISPELLMGLQQLGFEKPTEIQRRAFPVIRSGEDAVLLDETGTGKTLAYVLPVLQSMLDERAGLADAGLADELGSPSDRESDGESAGSQAMLLVPNRDLCVQVLATIQPLLNALPFDLEASALTESGAWGDADIVISTPGKSRTPRVCPYVSDRMFPIYHRHLSSCSDRAALVGRFGSSACTAWSGPRPLARPRRGRPTPRRILQTGATLAVPDRANHPEPQVGRQTKRSR